MFLTVRGVSKRYGPVTALSNVSAAFESGQIHAVLGENGAGKSTLMGVMAGFVRPDEGAVLLDGEPVPLGRPFECRRRGIEMIHQHFKLVPRFTVAENLTLARLPKLSSGLNLDQLAAPGMDAAKRLGWPLDSNARVMDLPVGVQQRIEILKALSGDARVLVFDEPTAVLAPSEVEDLFRVLRSLKEEGRVVVLIAHKLSEVLAVADRITVLRKGSVVGTVNAQDANEQSLAEMMVGEVTPTSEHHNRREALAECLALDHVQVKGDRGELAVRDISMRVNRGEILGIGGVDGNGQVELAEAIAGIRPISAGHISAYGEIAYVPQDRQTDGLALDMSILDNLLVGGLGRPDLSKGPFLRWQRIRQWANDLVARFDVKVASLQDPVSSLSGGNQQKVVVSRTLDRLPDLLVVCSPTRGLDFRATLYVHQKLREARDRGTCIVLFSTDLDELSELSDRTLFMSRGELATSLVGGLS